MWKRIFWKMTNIGHQQDVLIGHRHHHQQHLDRGDVGRVQKTKNRKSKCRVISRARAYLPTYLPRYLPTIRTPQGRRRARAGTWSVRISSPVWTSKTLSESANRLDHVKADLRVDRWRAIVGCPHPSRWLLMTQVCGLGERVHDRHDDDDESSSSSLRPLADDETV